MMTRMIAPDCAVMCNLTNTHTHTHDKPLKHFPRFWPHIFSEQSVVVGVEGVRFRPRAFVVGTGVIAVYMRISSQEYVYDNQPPGGLH